MQRVVILGAGGHAQVVADILLRAREAGSPIEPLGFLDDAADLQGGTLLDLPILGTTANLRRIPHDAVIIAIGNNHVRRRLFDHYQSMGEQFAIAHHPSAIIASNVVIGQGVMIAAGVIVNPGSTIGDDAILNTGCIVEHDNHIADHAHIAPGVRLGGDVEIGQGSLIGIGATVMPQRQVGQWSVVGAGALVHDNLPDYTVAIGVPARVVRHISER